jgi:hypothetical protein
MPSLTSEPNVVADNSRRSLALRYKVPTHGFPLLKRLIRTHGSHSYGVNTRASRGVSSKLGATEILVILAYVIVLPR